MCHFVFVFQDSVYDALFNNNVVPKQETKAPFQSSHNTKKASSNANNTEDFSYLFGMGGNAISRYFSTLYIKTFGNF